MTYIITCYHVVTKNNKDYVVYEITDGWETELKVLEISEGNKIKVMTFTNWFVLAHNLGKIHQRDLLFRYEEMEKGEFYDTEYREKRQG